MGAVLVPFRCRCAVRGRGDAPRHIPCSEGRADELDCGSLLRNRIGRLTDAIPGEISA